ncbi:hypothetical protein [Planktotalea sp.]|uniref:hypothetical protein n=1 Tax=Planktotalea sp. TaxID=2029877 RepID=UPI003299D31C
MSYFAKITAVFALSASLAGCQTAPNPSVTNAAAGAALGATVAAIAGGSRSDVAATALVGGIAGAALPVQ